LESGRGWPDSKYFLPAAPAAAHATAVRAHALSSSRSHVSWLSALLHLLLLVQTILFFRHGAAAGLLPLLNALVGWHRFAALDLLALLLLNLLLFTDLFRFGECGGRESTQEKAGNTSLAKVFPIHDVDPMVYGS